MIHTFNSSLITLLLDTRSWPMTFTVHITPTMIALVVAVLVIALLVRPRRRR